MKQLLVSIALLLCFSGKTQYLQTLVNATITSSSDSIGAITSVVGGLTSMLKYDTVQSFIIYVDTLTVHADKPTDLTIRGKYGYVVYTEIPACSMAGIWYDESLKLFCYLDGMKKVLPKNEIVLTTIKINEQ